MTETIRIKLFKDIYKDGVTLLENDGEIVKYELVPGTYRFTAE